MSRFLLLISLGALFASQAEAAEKRRNCPAGILIIRFNTTPNFPIGSDTMAVVFSDVLRQELRGNVHINAMAQSRQEVREQGREKGTVTDVPASGDFVISGRGSTLGEALTVTAAVHMSDGTFVGRASRNYKSDETSSGMEKFEENIDKDLTVIAQEFAEAISRRFLCVKLEPKSKRVSFSDPSQRTFPIKALVRDLKNRAVEDEEVQFWNRKASEAEVNPTVVKAKGGIASSVYTMKKEITEDTVYADLNPKGGIPTRATMAVTGTDMKCLVVGGKTLLTVNVEGEHFQYELAQDGRISLLLNEENQKISGMGTLYQTRTIKFSGEAEGNGKSPQGQSTQMTVKGTWDKGHAEISMSTSDNPPVMVPVTVEGVTIMLPFAQSGWKDWEVIIPLADGSSIPYQKTYSSAPGTTQFIDITLTIHDGGCAGL